MCSARSNLCIDSFRAGHRLRMHRHSQPYVALVIGGAYVETSLDGRFACRSGTLVIHPAFHEHANEFGDEPCTVLNLPVPEGCADLSGYRTATTQGVEALIRLARDDAEAAGRAALEELNLSAPIAPPRWLSCFLALLMADRPVGAAARACGVTAEHAGRVTTRWFGAPPSHLRREGRIRRAMQALREGAPPAEAAQEAGFCDQPHLTRVLKTATGRTPSTLRKY